MSNAFGAHYGSNPLVYAQIWEDLQQLIHFEATAKDFHLFLMSVAFPECYQLKHNWLLPSMFVEKRCESGAGSLLGKFRN
jgi:hypothetical protein